MADVSMKCPRCKGLLKIVGSFPIVTCGFCGKQFKPLNAPLEV